MVPINSNWVGGRWSDRVGRKQLMVDGWILYAVVYLGFCLIRQPGIWSVMPISLEISYVSS